MRRNKIVWSEPTPISVQIGKSTYQGSYQTGGGMIEVSYGFHSKSTQLGGSARAPGGLAKLILSELVRSTRLLQAESPTCPSATTRQSA